MAPGCRPMQDKPHGQTWERVSPLALIYFLFRAVPGLINLWPALVGIFAAGEEVRALFWSYGLYLLLLLTVASTVLAYWFFRFQVQTDRIQIRSGVFNRKHLVLKYERVQQADIAQPFYLRPFELAVLGLESAGSSQQEVNIPGLSLDRAQTLKSQILAYSQAEVEAEPADASDARAVTSPEIPETDFRLQLSWQEVARYGLMHNSLILFLPLLGPVFDGYLPRFDDWLNSPEGNALRDTGLALFEHQPLVLLAAMATFAVIATVLAIYVISVAAALIRYWGYTLTRQRDRYESRAGLTTLRTRGFRLHKLQLVAVRQGFIARLLRRYSISISKAGGGVQQQNESDSRFIIPVLDRASLAAIQQQLDLPHPSWCRIHWVYLAGGMVFWGLAVTAGACVFAAQRGFHGSWGLLILPVVIAVLWRRWYCFKYDYQNEWISVRKGFLGRTVRHLPTVKIQKISIQQSPWLRPWGLANLTVWSTDGALSVPCIDHRIAEHIQTTVLQAEAEFRGKWM